MVEAMARCGIEFFCIVCVLCFLQQRCCAGSYVKMQALITPNAILQYAQLPIRLQTYRKGRTASMRPLPSIARQGPIHKREHYNCPVCPFLMALPIVV